MNPPSRRRARALVFLACFLVALPIASVVADELFMSDTFRLGERPRGDNGDLRETFANTSLNSFWLEKPGTNSVRWRAGDGQDFGWQFSASSIDPNEPPEDAVGGNGTITARGRPAALVPFSATGGVVAVAANLLPLNAFHSWVAIGFTSSGVLSNNFESNAQVWLRLYGNGDYEVRTAGTNGQVVSGHVDMPGFTPVKLEYEPATRRISGFVNEERFPDFTNALVADIQYAGLEANTGDPTYFGHANYFRVTRTAQRVVEPQLKITPLPAGPVLQWPTTNRFVLQHKPAFAPFSPWINLWPANPASTQFVATNLTGPNGFFRLREL